MKWFTLNPYAITNGDHLEGKGYKHGTHFISKSYVDGEPKYTLWEGDKMMGIYLTAEEARGRVELQAGMEIASAIRERGRR